MDQRTLDNCRARAARAEEQVYGLAREWRAFLDQKPWPGRVEHDAEMGWYRIYFDFGRPPPPRFAVIVGEIAHDLRATLDNLAWREAVEHVGMATAERCANSISFPLSKTRALFKEAKVLGYVGKDARALMEWHQPYKRTTRGNPKSLRLLHWFNRIDKHRAVHVTTIGAPSLLALRHLDLTCADGARLTGYKSVLVPGRRVHGHTEVARVRFAADGPDPQVSVQGTPPVSPGYGDPPRSLRGIGLMETVDQVFRVIEDFARLVP